MKFPRASGILLHPTSLSGDFGIGDFGPRAYEFVDFLAETRQTYWQILPLGPTGYGDSPYQSFSAFAGNMLIISPEMLVEDCLLTTDRISERPAFPSGRVDFGTVYHWKNEILLEAYRNLDTTENLDLHNRFDSFVEKNAWWLDDYALYRAIQKSQKQKPWYEWDGPLKLRETSAIERAREELSDEIREEKFYQFLFYKQWAELKAYANEKGVKIIGDVPIFVALDSADVWCNQDQFKLNDDGSAKVAAGVPPDYFSKTGQLWGNPIYDWDSMIRNDFLWWRQRIGYTLRTVDVIRIDHFRGFAAVWEVPGGDKTAVNGRWVDVPGKELFIALNNAFPELPVIAEDLGVITPDVEDLRDSFNLPGMKILQFAFSGDSNDQYLPHNYINNCAVYTGTHDNDTSVGWFKSKAGTNDRKNFLKYLHSNGREVNWDFIRAAWASVADTAIAPMQDLLGLGNEARMNLPATTGGNWSWRLSDSAVNAEVAARLKEITERYGRGGNG